MTDIEEQTTTLLRSLADDAPASDYEDLERRLALMTTEASTTNANEVEVVLLNISEESNEQEHRRLPLVAAAALFIVAAFGLVTVVSQSDPADNTGSANRAPEVENAYWTQEPGGPRTVDLGPLVDDTMDWPPAVDLTYTLIDASSLPDKFEIEFEVSGRSSWLVAEDIAAYTQVIEAVSADGVDLSISLYGQTSPDDASESAGLGNIPSGWSLETIRGVDGRASGKAIAWIEPDVGQITIRTTSGTSAELLLLAEELTLTTTTFVEEFYPEVPPPEWESTATPVFAGPLSTGGTWTFDTAEVLIVDGIPGSTGRLPNTPATSPTVVAVLSGNAAAIAGVAPASVTTIRVVTSRGETAVIATATSPKNENNSLFAFGLPVGLDATRVELLDSGRDLLFSYDIPPIRFPTGGNLMLERSDP